jgi:hypothetical protein
MPSERTFTPVTKYLITLPCRTYTFWRFTLAIELQENEITVSYSVNNGQSIDFFVPGRSQNFRWATHSVSSIQRRSTPTLMFSLPGNSAMASQLG